MSLTPGDSPTISGAAFVATPELRRAAIGDADPGPAGGPVFASDPRGPGTGSIDYHCRTLGIPSLLGLAYAVGWRGAEQVTAVAVCLAESSGFTCALYVNSDSHLSRDRGLWQINDYWHPDVVDACAFTPKCNARNAFKISGGGTSWTPWATYNKGMHKQYLDDVQAVYRHVDQWRDDAKRWGKAVESFDPTDAAIGIAEGIAQSWEPQGIVDAWHALGHNLTRRVPSFARMLQRQAAKR